MPTQLVLKAGETLLIDPSFKWEQVYDLFKLGDGATLILQQNMTMRAIRSEFGTGCRIIARGPNGPDGSHGPSYPSGKGDDCGTGKEGARGSQGTPGQAGFNVSIQSGLAVVGELTIDAGGGNGGNGGNGQEGGKGGTGKCVFCRGGVGGQGGNGGDGGRGGDGGKIKLRWTPLPSLVVDQQEVDAEQVWAEHRQQTATLSAEDLKEIGAIPSGHSYSASYGTGGNGGQPGGPGHGGDGVRCGILGKQGGGDRGTGGQRGKAGRLGSSTPYECQVG